MMEQDSTARVRGWISLMIESSATDSDIEPLAIIA